MKFRKDINALRAIAVSSVVLFHFNNKWVPSGFIGVDVFFVISGFLMTGIIFSGMERNEFSTIKFIKSRIDRIFPPLLILCVFVLTIGVFLLPPYELKKIAKHLLGSISFLSNFVYLSESGYFDTNSQTKWLLHTWSLSIEWQFYLIYPILLSILKRYYSLERLKWIILIIAISSLVISVIISPKFPNASYYMLPTRAWEMLIGSIAYLYPIRLKGFYKESTFYSGLVLVISACFIFDESSVWPGVNALLPVIGAYLLIVAAKENSIIFNNRFVQYLGKWSYSIYLWHWPLVVIIYYYNFDQHFTYIGIVLSIVLGWLSFSLIEQRKSSKPALLPVTIFSVLFTRITSSVVILALISFAIFISKGLQSQVPRKFTEVTDLITPSPYRKSCHIYKYSSPKDACIYEGSNLVTWAVIGDSHGTEIAYSLAKKLKSHNISLAHFTFSACKPSFDTKLNRDYECSKWYSDVINHVLANKDITNVVIAHRLTKYVVGGDSLNYPYIAPFKIDDTSKEVLTSLTNASLALSKEKTVYIISPIPELPRDINILIGRRLKLSSNFTSIEGTSRQWFEARNSYVKEYLKNANYPNNVFVINPEEKFCNEVKCFAVKDNKPLYFDHYHPSVWGGELIAELILDK